MTTENDRLDERTEKMISNVRDFAVEHGKPKAVAVRDCLGCQRQATALRSRIRTLIEEARNIGYANGQSSVLNDDVFINGDGGGFQ